MKTKPKYFPIIINAQSEEELSRRIADNETRGFELVHSDVTEHEYNMATSSHYKSVNGTTTRYRTISGHKVYRAQMRRPNDHYVERS